MPPENRRRILLAARPATGGLRSHLIQLLAHLDRARFRVALGAPAQLIASLPDALPEYTAFPLTISARPGPADLIAALQIVRYARREKCVVHAHGIRAGFVAATAHRIARFPLVVTYHNIPEQNRLNKFALRCINSQTDAIITVSKAIAQRIEGSRARIIPNGIDLTLYGALDRAKARKDLQLDDTQTAVVCLARLAPEKGVDLLLQAAELLPELTFLVAGTGPESQTLAASAGKNVHFLGYIDNVPSLFAAADIVAIPSRSEGQGIVALEAMAAKAPIVAFNVGGLGEMIVHNQTGLLAAPGNPSALAKEIEKLANNPSLRTQLASNAHDWVMANGDVQARVREVATVYEQVGDEYAG